MKKTKTTRKTTKNQKKVESDYNSTERVFVKEEELLNHIEKDYGRTRIIEYQEEFNLNQIVYLESIAFKVAHKENWYNKRSGECFMYILKFERE